MAKRTPNSSRPAEAARTTTTNVEPSAATATVPLAAVELSAAPTAVQSAAPEPSPAPAVVPVPVLGLPPALVSLPAVTETGKTSLPQPTTLAGGTMDLEDTMGQVNRVYRAITGRDAPLSDAPYALIPAEKDPVQHVEEQLGRLLDVLSSTLIELGSY